MAFNTNRRLYKFRADPANCELSEGYFRILRLITVLQQDCGVRYNPERIKEPDFSSPGGVGSADQSLLLGAWGDGHIDYDLNGDGVVNGIDLALLLASWGSAGEPAAARRGLTSTHAPAIERSRGLIRRWERRRRG